MESTSTWATKIKKVPGESQTFQRIWFSKDMTLSSSEKQKTKTVKTNRQSTKPSRVLLWNVKGRCSFLDAQTIFIALNHFPFYALAFSAPLRFLFLRQAVYCIWNVGVHFGHPKQFAGPSCGRPITQPESCPDQRDLAIRNLDPQGWELELCFYPTLVIFHFSIRGNLHWYIMQSGSLQPFISLINFVGLCTTKIQHFSNNHILGVRPVYPKHVRYLGKT